MSSEFSRGLLLRAVGHGVSVCLVQQKHAEKVYIQTDCEEEETTRDMANICRAQILCLVLKCHPPL